MGKWHGNNINLVLGIVVYKEWNLKNLHVSKKWKCYVELLKKNNYLNVSYVHLLPFGFFSFLCSIFSISFPANSCTSLIATRSNYLPQCKECHYITKFLHEDKLFNYVDMWPRLCVWHANCKTLIYNERVGAM